MENSNPTSPEIHFLGINSKNVSDVCELSDTLSDAQQKMVADNARSIAQAHCSENSWMRAIYADNALVGFILVHFGSDFDLGFIPTGDYYDDEIELLLKFQD